MPAGLETAVAGCKVRMIFFCSCFAVVFHDGSLLGTRLRYLRNRVLVGISGSGRPDTGKLTENGTFTAGWQVFPQHIHETFAVSLTLAAVRTSGGVIGMISNVSPS